jgi:hypothetical protein
MIKKNIIALCCILLWLCPALHGQATRKTPKKTLPAPSLLERHYRLGETLNYVMKGVNEGRRYEAHARAVVKKDTDGTVYEEYVWTGLKMNGADVPLPASDFRQDVSLALDYNMSIPNFGTVPMLVGPVLDLMTFYVDLQLAERQDLAHAGDHVYVKVNGANSWADGRYVLMGEDSLDFDLTLEKVDTAAHVATLLVKHVPPAQPEINVPADWMRKPVADTANNWMEVHKDDQGKYVAAVGKETFDVHIQVDLNDGKILSATMNNPVQTIERTCSDEALTNCGEAKPHNILRQVELTLQR